MFIRYLDFEENGSLHNLNFLSYPSMRSIGYLVVNFGGPRHLNEVEPFLRTLLNDKEVIRTRLPRFLHSFLFSRVAKKRAVTVAHDYQTIGGASPIYEDTEYVASALRQILNAPVCTFHRYLSSTHKEACEKIEKMSCSEIRVFPMFPQFTYATTGSIALFFKEHLPAKTVAKLKWVKSYPTHPAFVKLFQHSILEFMHQKELQEEDTILLFSAHGLPREFVNEGDIYEYECHASFSKIMEAFPNILGRLAFQSKFGPGEWLRPYTIDVCEEIELWNGGRKNVLFVPISFTSDHIETLFEIEQLYMTLILQKGLHPFRLPAFNRSTMWIEAIAAILKDFNPISNRMLIRN